MTVWRWMRDNLFSSWGNGALTVAVAAFLWWLLPPLYDWAIRDATLWGDTKAACGDGACWAFIRQRLPLFIFGLYPPAEQWRVVLAFVLLVACSVPVLRAGTRHVSIWQRRGRRALPGCCWRGASRGWRRWTSHYGAG